MIKTLGWTKSSAALLSLFLLVVLLIAYFWWPLAEMVIQQVDWGSAWWLTFDWLLVGIFLVMTGLIVSGADLKRDALILFVGVVGGLVIESWGTQTRLWTYFTNERPPLWIIPAWPIASLSIARIVRLADILAPKLPARATGIMWGLAMAAFSVIMLAFIWPALDKPMTLAALALCATLILLPGDTRLALLYLGAGIGLGYFLEVWGTTRECWTYYTHETPPLFAVLAHGMAAVAFWRAGMELARMTAKLRQSLTRRPERARAAEKIAPGHD